MLAYRKGLPSVSSEPTVPAKVDAVVVGGSIAGLASAFALCRQGLTVACLERDATPMPEDHLAAWERWRRDGAGQTRHSHVLLAPLVNSIKDDLPGFFATLRASGAEVLTFREIAANTFEAPEFEPGDDRIEFLACRRVVFEFLLRRHLLESIPATELTFASGADVRALRTVTDGDRQRVAGVTVKMPDGVVDIDAGIVVDASGRNSRAHRWLAAAGAEPPPSEDHPCGIFYTSRFYRLRDGANYPQLDGRQSLTGGVAGVDLGYVKAGVFRSDNRTFSITLAADPEDVPLRRIAQEREFDVATRLIDASRPWVEETGSMPISKVYLYGNLTNSRRRYFVDGRPLVAGLFAVGDASVHTNPLAGRGCALAWVSAFELADVLDTESDALRRAAAFEERNERRIVPWYEYQVERDLEAIAVNKALQRGEDPFDFTRPDGSIDDKLQRRVILRKGLRYASREDIRILRLLFRQVSLLDPPGFGGEHAKLAPALLKGYERSKDEPEPRPRRTEFIEALGP